MAGLQMGIEIIAREKGGWFVQRNAEGVMIDRYVTNDLTGKRRNASWSANVNTWASTPLGVTVPPESTAHWDAWKEYVLGENAR